MFLLKTKKRDRERESETREIEKVELAIGSNEAID